MLPSRKCGKKMEMKDLKRLLKLKVLNLNSKQSLVLKNIFQFVGRQIRTDENITPPPSPNKNWIKKKDLRVVEYMVSLNDKLYSQIQNTKKINKYFLLGLIYCNLDTDSVTSMTINAIHIAHSWWRTIVFLFLSFVFVLRSAYETSYSLKAT